MKQFLFMLLLLFLLLVFHNETIEGTRNGLLLWYQTLIPSLLPFILVTNALSETNAYQAAAARLKKFFPNRIYEIMAILLGNLCGYPIGGKIISGFVKNRYIQPQAANRILSLSSQASPMFLIGYVHMHIIGDAVPLPVFLSAIYVPVILCYPYFTRFNHDTAECSGCLPEKSFCISDTFLHAVQIMVTIGIYVIIFSIILCILLPVCQHTVSKLFLSLLEITTGLKLLYTLSLPVVIKLPFLCALSSFGGLCSAFQIKGVLDYSSASIKKYLLDKMFLSAGTFFIIWAYLKFLA